MHAAAMVQMCSKPKKNTKRIKQIDFMILVISQLPLLEFTAYSAVFFWVCCRSISDGTGASAAAFENSLPPSTQRDIMASASFTLWEMSFCGLVLTAYVAGSHTELDFLSFFLKVVEDFYHLKLINLKVTWILFYACEAEGICA
jgi:hypothetical protein